MKRIAMVLTGLVVAGVATAQNVPSGVTGLWRFQDSADRLKATIGTDLVTSHPDNSGWLSVPWTVLEPGLSDGGGVQERSYDYLTVTHGIAPNGGGSYVNEYTVAIDYIQTSGIGNWNSLFQTADDAHANDGDLWTDTTGHIGVGATGYSSLTYNPNQWHRIMWSVDNGSFFRVYVDGTLFLDAAGQPVDGRFSLGSNFHLFADNDWEDQWGIVSTAAVWDHALTTEEVAGMGSTATPLTLAVPEPTATSLLALAGLVGLIKRTRK
jgi:hypothetical protein